MEIPPDPVTVAIVEDDRPTVERFRAALGADGRLRVVATFDTGGAALRWLEHQAPQVLLCDLGLPDLPGLAVITYCAQRHPRTDIMVTTMYEDETHVMRSLEAGASGYLLKDSLEHEIAARVLELAAGGAPMSPVIARQVLRRFRPAHPVQSRPAELEARPLSERETVVLTRIAQGFSYAEIAEIEGVSRHTVHTHIKNIYAKLAVHSRSEAVFEAGRMGLIDTSLRS